MSEHRGTRHLRKLKDKFLDRPKHGGLRESRSSGALSAASSCDGDLLNVNSPPNHHRQSNSISASSPGLGGSLELDGRARIVISQLDEPSDHSDLAPSLSTDLWLAAYRNLQESKPKLIDAYEKILSRQLHPSNEGPIITNESPNFFSAEDAGTVISYHRSIVSKALAKAKKREAMQDGILDMTSVITHHAKSIQGMLNTCPPAAMAWSGFCVGLPLLTSTLKQNKAMRSGLKHVMQRMEWYMALDQLLLLNNWEGSVDFHMFRSSMQSTIVQLYEQLLEFEVTCLCRCFYQHPIIRVAKDMLGLRDLEATLKSLETLETQVDRDVERYGTREMVCHLESIAKVAKGWGAMANELSELVERMKRQEEEAEVQKMRAQVEAEARRDRRRSDLIARFSTTLYSSHLENVTAHLPGTCKWFRKNSKYTQWVHDSNHNILLVSAEPGCGKSVLARYLIEEELPFSKDEAEICYFFFKDQAERNDISIALCAILHRLFQHKRFLIDSVEKEVLEAGSTLTRNASLLWEILLKVCSSSQAGEVICVFDALDECDPKELQDFVAKLKRFAELHTHTNIRLKFLLTTRGYPSILEPFDNFATSYAKIDSSEDAVASQIQEEIDLVLSSRLDDFAEKRKLRADLKISLKLKLEERGGEQRTYLWARLVFESLNKAYDVDESALIDLISELPDSVTKAYENLLARVDQWQKKKVRTLLGLIVGAFYPLSLRELNIALNVRGHQRAVSEEALGLMDDRSFHSWLLETCGYFVTVYNGDVHLIHQTAKEFVLGKRKGHEASTEQPQGKQWEGSMTMTAAHALVAESCVAYLSLDTFRTDEFLQDKPVNNMDVSETLLTLDHPSFKSHGFLQYSIRHWVDHFAQAQVFLEENDMISVTDIREEFWESYQSLFDMSFGTEIPWLSLYKSVQKPRFELTRYSDSVVWTCPCHVAAFFGHFRMLQLSMQAERHQLNIQGHSDDFALLFAISSNSEYCVSLLFSGGWSATIRDEEKSTWLHLAVQNGFESVVKKHIHDVSSTDLVNATNASGTTALHLACQLGSLEIVEVLIEANANVNARDDSRNTPLHFAAELPNVKMIKRLLAAGARVNVTNEEGLTPLHNACAHEDLKATRLLVEAKANINAKKESGCGDTPLHVAVRESNVEMVDWLIKLGASATAANSQKRTPLHLVSSKGLPMVVTIFQNVLELLTGGTDNGLSTLLGRRKLDEVRTRDRITKMLLACGADVNCKASDGSTPMHFAAEWGFEDQIERLLAEGGDIHATADMGQQPLHFAARSLESSFDCVRLLLWRGAYIEARDHRDQTPLHKASRYDRMPQLICLLLHGADRLARDRRGRTPLEVARKAGAGLAVAVLLQWDWIASNLRGRFSDIPPLSVISADPLFAEPLSEVMTEYMNRMMSDSTRMEEETLMSFAEMLHLCDPDSSDDDVGAADDGGNDLDGQVSPTQPPRNLFVLRAFAVLFCIMFLLWDLSLGTLGTGYMSIQSRALSNSAKYSARYSTKTPVKMKPRSRDKTTKRKGPAARKPSSRQTSKKKQKSTAKTPVGAEPSRTRRKSEL